MSIESCKITKEFANSQRWDAIVVGSGMGGGAAAYALTNAGMKVLIVEQGKLLKNSVVKQGVTSEIEDNSERLASGQWPYKITTQVNSIESDIWPPMGCGVGGSTLLYAAALQRLEPMDFGEQDLPDGSTVAWPFSYDELVPYYKRAEKLLGVKGTIDPRYKEVISLAPPPPMCEADQNYFEAFRREGLNPFRLHVGIDYVEGCSECGGSVCPKSCKRDALNSFIAPAADTGNLALLSETEVSTIKYRSGSVNGIELRSGEILQAKTYFLAAGALNSVKILLDSKATDDYSLGDHSGNLGRNLMFHASDFVAVWPTRKSSRVGANKTIAFRDFYKLGSEKFGEFQSTGLAAGYGNILYASKLAFDQSRFRKIPIIKQFLRIPAYLMAKILGEASIFATIVEDYPYSENRVVRDHDTPSGFKVIYTIHPEFKGRVKKMTGVIRKRLKSLRSFRINLDITLNYGHPCGTCRASTNPEDGVVDKNCKVHGVDNLFITDASFMPTSGGTNPSLTIAANALRVADYLVNTKKS